MGAKNIYRNLYEQVRNRVKEEFDGFYERCIAYLDLWENSFGNVKQLSWVNLTKTNAVDWENAETSAEIINSSLDVPDMKINNDQLFDELVLAKESMSSTPVPVPGSNKHLIEETLSHSQPSEGSPSRPISSSGRPLGEYGRHLVNSHVVGLLPWNKLLFSSEEKKPRRTSLQVQLTKQPSSESLNFSPTSPGVASWMDNNSRMSDYPSPDKLQPGPEMTSDKLTRKESYKAQRKNYCREKKRVANELLSSLKDPSVVVMADWLKVRGTLKSWTKLWCILKPGLLLLYKSPKVKSNHWVGTVLLNTCQVIERPSKKDGFCFKLFHPLEQSIWAPRGPEKESIGKWEGAQNDLTQFTLKLLSLNRGEHTSHFTLLSLDIEEHTSHFTLLSLDKEEHSSHTTLLSLNREEYSSHFTLLSLDREEHSSHFALLSLDREEHSSHFALLSLDKEEHSSHTTLLSLDREEHSAVVQPLPTAYLIFRAPSQAAGKCWLDALELSLRCSSLLVRSMSSKSNHDTTTNHETQWSEADYEKHFTDHADALAHLGRLLKCFRPKTPSTPQTKLLLKSVVCSPRSRAPLELPLLVVGPERREPGSCCPSPSPFFQQLYHAVAFMEREMLPTPIHQPDPERPTPADLDDLSQPDGGLGDHLNGADQTSLSDTDSERDETQMAEGEPLETPYINKEEIEEFGSAGEQVEELGEEHRSLIWYLVKQVRPGMDLSKVVLPTFILEPRSFLDKLADSYYHADILAKYPTIYQCQNLSCYRAPTIHHCQHLPCSRSPTIHQCQHFMSPTGKMVGRTVCNTCMTSHHATALSHGSSHPLSFMSTFAVFIALSTYLCLVQYLLI
uniref:PH domain-containing protein n=1 Tax=Timema genevievae TaxID=629358 RepID=A0A7R9K3I9_TIMGE|nr:unnamed protein product [Timema genevievae]